MPRGEVLVVHCVDTEGPIGGNVRRRPDGSQEFYGTWGEIERSIRRLTGPGFRKQAADSFGNPYIYNWFIMDFTGFRTNPKQRIAQYNDTYDHFKKLPTAPDGFYWHYHHPPASGKGDEWSGEWGSGQEYKNILLHRLVEREDFPEAFRAGGTIEDNAASAWLEDNIMIDYSNRVSNQSRSTKNIFDFNWRGAPRDWGYYHPARRNFLRKGNMRRYIVRSVDLWSRLHVLTDDEVREAFAVARQKKSPVILSYFSHDHREMYDETMYAISLVRQVSKETGVPWRSVRALESVQMCARIRPRHVRAALQRRGDELDIVVNGDIWQRAPWVGARRRNGSLTWLPVRAVGRRRFRVAIHDNLARIVIGGTSATGNSFVKGITV